MTGAPSSTQSLPLQTLVLRPLLHSIFSGEIPGGARLIEQDIAEKLGISRAPVREALREIAAMGLVELRPNRGAVVCPFNAESVRGIYRVRMALESDAASLAAGKIPAAEVETCERIFEDLLINRATTHAWSERAIESDEKFHEMIATHCGVPRLAMEIRRYKLLVLEIRQALGGRYKLQEEAIHQHVAILAALRGGAADEAAHAMRKHILDATERALEALFPKAAS
jgi:DNA-binding GntR family transcriptional regulator